MAKRVRRLDFFQCVNCKMLYFVLASGARSAGIHLKSCVGSPYSEKRVKNIGPFHIYLYGIK